MQLSKIDKLYLVFLLLYIFYYLGIFLAPIFKYYNYDFLSNLLYYLYSHVCHQMPERSYFILGYKMAVCARCFGIYTGFLLGYILYPIIKGLNNFKIPNKKYLILSLIPIGLDGGTQLLGLRESFNTLRFITGFIFGFTIVFYIVPIFFSFIKSESMEIDEIKKLAKDKSLEEKKLLYEQYKKNEVLAIILSFLIPGLGQIYLGDTGKGVLMIVLFLIGVLLTFICIGTIICLAVWIWSIIDAYETAKKYNLELYRAIFNEN